MATSALGYQSFYQAQLTSNIDDTDLIIPLDTAPIPEEGFLVIESTVASKREIIYYTSKTSNSVTCPSGAGNGRGYDGTTAVSHLSGAAVIMAPVGAMFESLTDLFTTTPQGWTNLDAPSTVVANGNRSYTLTHASSIASTVSAGMRRRFTRTVAGPTTAFSLDGSNDYYKDTSVSGMTFTDDFSVSAWVYLTAYQVATIESRYNGTNGWIFRADADGTITLRGYNNSSVNYRGVQSYQSIPLNKWVHVAAQLDMSAHSVAGTTNSYIMVDGVAVPSQAIQAGTNPTSLIQAGNLEMGSYNGGTNQFPGYLDQVAVYSAKVTQADHLARKDQALTGSETNLISAYSNGSTTDLAATGNNLTAQGGATTVASSWHGNRGVSTTLEYGLTMSVSSDGLTEVVQVPEGCALPTSGGITASAYSTMANPYGFVPIGNRWSLNALDISYTTVNPLVELMLKAGIDTPIDAVRYTNTGTAGGAFYISQHGKLRSVTGTSAVCSTTTSSYFTYVFPNGLFGTLYELNITPGVVGSTIAQLIVLASKSTTTTNAYMVTTAGTGTMYGEFSATGIA